MFKLKITKSVMDRVIHTNEVPVRTEMKDTEVLLLQLTGPGFESLRQMPLPTFVGLADGDSIIIEFKDVEERKAADEEVAKL